MNKNKQSYRSNEELVHALTWNIEETARMLGRSKAWVYIKLQEGVIPQYNDDSVQTLLLRADVEAAVKRGFRPIEETTAA